MEKKINRKGLKPQMFYTATETIEVVGSNIKKGAQLTIEVRDLKDMESARDLALKIKELIK